MIQLDKAAIEKALPLVAAGLDKYCLLQTALPTADVAHDRKFQKQFNGFYRIRRNAVWRSAFYALLQQEKLKPRCFDEVIRSLHAETGRVEASFASKLAATIDPGRPVIDSIVLKNLGLRISRVGAVEDRLAKIVELRDDIERKFSVFLVTDMGRYLMTRFEETYPDRHLTPVKMLDLVLWQTR